MSAVESHYEPQSALPEVKFVLTNVQPPSNLYVGREDTLVITTLNSAANAILQIHGRVLLPDGKVIPFVYSHTPNTNRTGKDQAYPIPEGFLLNVTVMAGGGVIARGQCYVIVRLGRGDAAARVDHQVLTQGYVAVGVNQAWPGNKLDGATEGPGNIRDIVGTVPGAGAEILETVPTGARWRLLAILFQLTTAVAAANREPTLVLIGANGTYAQISPTVAQAASLVHTYTFAPGVGVDLGVGGTRKGFSLPTTLIMKAGYQFGTSTLNIQGADQYAAPVYCVEEWIEP